MNGAVKVLCCAVGLLLLVSCAGLLGYGKTEANLMKNVTAFWTAKMNGEWGAAYDLATEEFKRQVSRVRFVKSANLNIEHFEIEKVTLLDKEDKAEAVVKYRVGVKAFVFDLTAKDTWVWEKGAWRVDLTPTLKLPGA